MKLESFHDNWVEAHRAPFPYHAKDTGMGDAYVSMDSSVDNATRSISQLTQALNAASKSSEKLAAATAAQASGLTRATWVLAWATILLALFAGIDAGIRVLAPQ